MTVSIDPDTLDRQRSLRIDDLAERCRKGYVRSVRRRHLFEAWILSERSKGREPSLAERVSERERIRRETKGL